MLMKVGFHHDPGPMSHSDAAFYVPFSAWIEKVNWNRRDLFVV